MTHYLKLAVRTSILLMVPVGLIYVGFVAPKLLAMLGILFGFGVLITFFTALIDWAWS